MLAGAGSELSIYLYLADADAELERGVTTADISTGCVPVVNLFPLRAEPIRLDGTAFEHRIVPDARRPDALEIYSVEKVTASDVDANEYTFEPFFGLRHDAGGDVRFWHASRRQAAGARDKGNELFISLMDREADAGAPANWTLSVDTLCFNRELLARIPSVGGQIPLDFVSPSPAVRRSYMVSPFSPTRRPPLGNGRMWRLLSHLSLNHLSMAGNEDGGEALREILRLYDWGQGLETRRLIDGVRSVSSKRGLARIVLGRSTAITQGLDVEVLLDPQNYPPGSAYLLACVLEHFFGLYVAVNTFSRLTVRLSGRTGVLATWPPRTGEKTLL
jgi:type VI secretion system protein ImpG